MDGGIPEVITEAIADRISTPYYLLFGREMDDEGKLKKVWVELELPEGGYMECLLESHRELLYLQITQLMNDFNYFKMQEAIKLVENKVMQQSTCCYPSARSTCDLCLTSQEVKILFEGRNSISSPSSVDIDPIALQSGTSRSGVLVGEDYWIVNMDGEGRLISDVVADIEDLMTEINLSFQAFITSNSTTCDEQAFQSIENDYYNSNADVRMRLHIDEEARILYEVPDFSAIWDYYGEEIIDYFDTQVDSLVPKASPRSGFEPLECKRTNRYNFTAAQVMESHEDAYITPTEGVIAHNIIQFYYRTMNWFNDIQLEYKSPEASSKNPGIQPGYADIVNLTTGEIFEIKTVNSWKKGEEEVILYVDKANEHCLNSSSLPINFSRGNNYPPRKELEWPTSNKRFITYRAKQAAPENGVITYELVQNNQEWKPSPDQVFIPQTKIDKLKDVLKDMVNSPTPKDVAIDFFTENPEMIGYVVIASVGTIVIVSAGAIKTAGISLIPSGKLAVVSGILLAVALTVEIEPGPQSP